MKLKKFLPFENYVLTSNLSAEEITKRLNENVEPKKGFKFLHGEILQISRMKGRF